jgi:hypothetical protein
MPDLAYSLRVAVAVHRLLMRIAEQHGLLRRRLLFGRVTRIHLEPGLARCLVESNPP